MINWVDDRVPGIGINLDAIRTNVYPLKNARFRIRNRNEFQTKMAKTVDYAFETYTSQAL